MIIVVTGGRDFTSYPAVAAALDKLHAAHPITGLIHGGARGVDILCADWAFNNGVPDYPHFADWDTHGKAAGMIRNQQMLHHGPPPQYTVAFPGGRGTADMTRRCVAAGLTVYEPYSLK